MIKYIIFYRRQLMVALAALVVLAFSVPSWALESSDVDVSYEDVFQKNNVRSIDAPFDSEDTVRVIVELEDDPLLDEPALQSASSAKQYMKSSKGQKKDLALFQEQKRVQRKINTSNIDIDITHNYSAVINGFSANIKFGDISEIQSIDGVSGVYIAQEHKLIEPKLTDSVGTIGGEIMQASGYTGKGTCVAILDTGLETSHEAFKGSVNNPKFSKTDISNSITNNRLTIGKLSADVVYQSSKIPYAFDYADNDYNVSGGASHGTHVAGIVGANSGGTIKGVAPDAQLFIMKVFKDGNGGAYDDDILAALDDSVKLGCDSINMSLGSTAGFSVAGSKDMREVYERIDNAGIVLMCAAGNDYSSSYHGSTEDLPLASNPDNSTVSSPSTYATSMSVASVNNEESTEPYFLHDKQKIRYLDSAEDGQASFASLEGTFEYVDCGSGGKADFAGKDLKGKIALIERGGLEGDEILTFTQKETYAKNAGAEAAIVYDNTYGSLVSMATEHNIPICFISKENGEELASADNKIISADQEYLDKFSDEFSGKMSDFSSWGVTPDLKLKPEITAPGGNIYSSVPGNTYGSMSGTSMASPHMAGASSVILQYINTELDGYDMTQSERRDLTNALLISTAAPLKEDNGAPVSPRKQGAGLVQLQNASNSSACIWGKDKSRPIMSLGQSKDGNFDFSFDVQRLKDGSSIDYQVDVTAETESVVTKNGKKYIAQHDRLLKSDEVNVSNPEKLTLGKKNVSCNISVGLTSKGKNALDADFPNGIFIEGYVTLTPVNGNETTPLSLPFMGFYGDWNNADMFDSTIYDDKDAAIEEMYLAQFDNYTGGGFPLGTNVYGDADIVDENKIAIKGGDTSTNVTAVCTLLRNADMLNFSAEDSEGESIYSETRLDVSKSYYGSEGTYQPTALTGWIMKDEWNDPFEDGNYTYTVEGSVSGGKQSVSFPVTIDSEKPEIVSSRFKGNKWFVTVKDNHYVQAVGVTTGSAPLTGWINPDEKTAGAETTIVFNLNDPELKDLSSARIAIVDYADNQYVSDPIEIDRSTASDDTDEFYPPNLAENNEYYMTSSGDAIWESAMSLDANGDGIIDVEDFVLNSLSR